MAYAPGDDILAAHYNAFRTQVNSFWGTGNGESGYGNTDIPAVNVGDKIFGQNWVNLANAVEDSAEFQGTTLPAVWPTSTKFQKGQPIVAFDGVARPIWNPDGLNIQSGITLAQNNRNIFDLAYQDITGNAFVDSFTGSWNQELQHTINVSFSGENDARYFFNTGGQIRLNFSRTGGTTTGTTGTQNASWTQLLDDAGTFIFDWNAPAGGFYGLTDTYATLATYSVTGAYSANQLVIQGRRVNFVGVNGGNGSEVELLVRFQDNHPSFIIPPVVPPFNAPVPVPDAVDGTFTTALDFRKTNFFNHVETPTFTGSSFTAT